MQVRPQVREDPRAGGQSPPCLGLHAIPARRYLVAIDRVQTKEGTQPNIDMYDNVCYIEEDCCRMGRLQGVRVRRKNK